jgi:uncharacterized protein (DUF362 family)/Pyruvate/2-oxoacid:ferredoxin oxidoreductase delta subunit
MDKVSVLKCDSYDLEKISAIVEQQFCEFETEKPIVKNGDTVVIKPNLVIRRRPNDATTTHPDLIAAIIRAVKKRGGKPVIAESPGGPYTRANLHSVYDGTGMTETAKREGAEINYDTSAEDVPSNGVRKVSSFNIISPILHADVVISAAKLKTHGQMVYSGAVKNLFGSIPGLAKPEFHYRFPEKPDFASMIVDLCETIKPAISFIDGIVGMEGNGPTGGTPKELGLLFAGTNPHSLDLVACSYIGYTSDKIPTLAEAVSRGLCPADVSQVEVIGDGANEKPKKFKVPDSFSIDFTENLHLPAFLKKPIEKLATPRPAIIKKTCIGCGKCAESCPQHTIVIKNRIAEIDYSKCIRCYCCHEMCPKRSIKIKRNWLFRM